MVSKTCSKCKQTLDVSEFNNDRQKKDGLQFHCRSCDKLKKKEYRTDNYEKDLLAKRRWRQNNVDQSRLSASQWAKNNPEKRAAVDARKRARKSNTYCSPNDAQDRRRIKEEQPQCIKCGSTDRLAIDHKLPVFFGGASCYNNYQVLCTSCNSSKGTKYVDYKPRALLTIDISAHKTEHCSQLSSKITQSSQNT